MKCKRLPVRLNRTNNGRTILNFPSITSLKRWPELIATFGLLMASSSYQITTHIARQASRSATIAKLPSNHPGVEPHATTTTTSTTTTSTTTTTEPAPEEPRGGHTLIPGQRIVAFYGAPGGSGLGILGKSSPEAMWPKLKAQAAPYQVTGTPVLPAYELITYIAQGSPQPNGTYSARLPNSTIQQYLDVVQEHNGLLILDIQPGRGNFLKDAKTLAPFLSQPDVALALDPEWQVSATQVPGQIIGSTTANDINQVSNWLEELVTSNHLPQKLLLIHQFKTSMVTNKAEVVTRPDLAIVFNMDGFGSWHAKVAAYQRLAQDHRFPLGFKLFYKQDVPLEDPSQVMELQPQPDVIEYE